jgi:hypothetical protein
MEDPFELTVNNKGIEKTIQLVVEKNDPTHIQKAYQILQEESHWTTFTHVADTTTSARELEHIKVAMQFLLQLEDKALHPVVQTGSVAVPPAHQPNAGPSNVGLDNPIQPEMESTQVQLPPTSKMATSLSELNVANFTPKERGNILLQLLYMAKVQQDQGWHFLGSITSSVSKENIYLARGAFESDTGELPLDFDLIPRIGIVMVKGLIVTGDRLTGEIRKTDSFYSMTQIHTRMDNTNPNTRIGRYSPKTRWKGWASRVFALLDEFRVNNNTTVAVFDDEWVSAIKDTISTDTDVNEWWRSVTAIYNGIDVKKK